MQQAERKLPLMSDREFEILSVGSLRDSSSHPDSFDCDLKHHGFSGEPQTGPGVPPQRGSGSSQLALPGDEGPLGPSSGDAPGLPACQKLSRPFGESCHRQHPRVERRQLHATSGSGGVPPLEEVCQGPGTIGETSTIIHRELRGARGTYDPDSEANADNNEDFLPGTVDINAKQDARSSGRATSASATDECGLPSATDCPDLRPHADHAGQQHRQGQAGVRLLQERTLSARGSSGVRLRPGSCSRSVPHGLQPGQGILPLLNSGTVPLFPVEQASTADRSQLRAPLQRGPSRDEQSAHDPPCLAGQDEPAQVSAPHQVGQQRAHGQGPVRDMQPPGRGPTTTPGREGGKPHQPGQGQTEGKSISVDSNLLIDYVKPERGGPPGGVPAPGAEPEGPVLNRRKRRQIGSALKAATKTWSKVFEVFQLDTSTWTKRVETTAMESLQIHVHVKSDGHIPCDASQLDASLDLCILDLVSSEEGFHSELRDLQERKPSYVCIEVRESMFHSILKLCQAFLCECGSGWSPKVLMCSRRSHKVSEQGSDPCRATSTCHTDWWQHAGKEHVFASNWNLLQPLLLGKETPVDLVQVARKLAALEHGIESDDVYIYNLRDQRAATRRTLENYWAQLHEQHQDIPKFERVQPQHPLHTVLPIEEEDLPEDENIFNDAEDEQGQPAEDAGTAPLPGSRARTLQQLVQKAHEGLGHPHLERFLRILKGAKATKEVIQVAKQLRCSVCEKFSQTRPPRRAAPPRELGINEVVGADTLWLPAVQGRKRLALNLIDYASHFQMIIPLSGKSPEAVWNAYQVWRKFFGPPKQVWADQGGEFKGSFKQRLSDDGTHLEVSSLESPFQRGTVERHGKTFKAINHATWRELVDTTVMIKNRLAARGGFSPVQRVLGYLPRLPGGLMTDEGANSPDAGDLDPGDEGVARAMKMRKAAAQAFYEVDCDQALKNVLQGGPRPLRDYVVGQMVYFYKLGVGGTKAGHRQPQRWHGPARVIMTDYPGTVWLSYQGGLVKASPERIRPASEEEQLTVSGWLEGLVRARREFEEAPKRGYVDLSTEPLPPQPDGDDSEDNEEDADRDPLVPVRRVRAKVTTEDVPFERVPLPAPVPLPVAAASEMDTEAAMDNDHEADKHDPTSRPSVTRTRDSVDDENDEESGERPPKRSRIELLEVYYAKLETLFKTRQRKEVRTKDLSEPDRQTFQRAMTREIRNNLDTKAYQILDEVESEIIRGTKPDRIMESRYVKTAKPLEQCDIDKAVMDGVLLQGDHGGPRKAKVRQTGLSHSPGDPRRSDLHSPRHS